MYKISFPTVDLPIKVVMSRRVFAIQWKFKELICFLDVNHELQFTMHESNKEGHFYHTH